MVQTAWKSRKIDQRNQLHGLMVYQIKCDLPWFFEAREWCWDQLGPGIEYEHYINYMVTAMALGIDRELPSWCWDSSKYQGAALRHGKIYLANEDDMALFSMRWS